jgi:bifunctional DNA-binding transcriptional regulator/antitoxin component of YhaV-PrlF toxin-antitoxin module
MIYMIQSIQKIIRIGSSGGVTIPAKDLKRQNIAFGDEVEVIVRPLHKTSSEDQKIVSAAKEILNDYRKDFENLAKR